jgi:hypothetical protein
VDLAEHGSTPDEPSDRAFGLWGAGLGAAWALWPLVRRQPEAIRWEALVACGAVALLALLRPSLLGPVHRAFRRATRPVQRLSQALLLGGIFFALLTPVALLRRWLGESPIKPRFDRQARSYWIDRRPDDPPSSFQLPF